jgi:hypothetical protein
MLHCHLWMCIFSGQEGSIIFLWVIKSGSKSWGKNKNSLCLPFILYEWSKRLETLYEASLPLSFIDLHIVLTEGSNSYYGGSKWGGGYEIGCGCLFYYFTAHVFSSNYVSTLVGEFCCSTVNLGNCRRHFFLVKTISNLLSYLTKVNCLFRIFSARHWTDFHVKKTFPPIYVAKIKEKWSNSEYLRV